MMESNRTAYIHIHKYTVRAYNAKYTNENSIDKCTKIALHVLVYFLGKLKYCGTCILMCFDQNYVPILIVQCSVDKASLNLVFKCINLSGLFASILYTQIASSYKMPNILISVYCPGTVRLCEFLYARSMITQV